MCCLNGWSHWTATSTVSGSVQAVIRWQKTKRPLGRRPEDSRRIWNPVRRSLRLADAKLAARSERDQDHAEGLARFLNTAFLRNLGRFYGLSFSTAGSGPGSLPNHTMLVVDFWITESVTCYRRTGTALAGRPSPALVTGSMIRHILSAVVCDRHGQYSFIRL